MLLSKKNMSITGLHFNRINNVMPAFQAVTVQVFALITVLISAVLISYFFEIRISFLTLILMQSVSALYLSKIANMAVWWRWIHGVFPIAMYGMTLFNVPNELYLIGFLVTLSMFWTTFRSQVPFFPSRPIVREKVATLIPKNIASRMIDIGSGLGDLSMFIAESNHKCQVEGIEIAPLPWLISVIRAWIKRSDVQFTLGDYYALDFSEYDLVFAYLSPAAMPALWKKAKQEMREGSLLVSYEFDIPNISPSYTITSDSHPTIHVWEIASKA